MSSPRLQGSSLPLPEVSLLVSNTEICILDLLPIPNGCGIVLNNLTQVFFLKLKILPKPGALYDPGRRTPDFFRENFCCNLILGIFFYINIELHQTQLQG